MTEYVLFMRQLGILRPDELPPVTLVGVGGIGSCLAGKLAKMGVKRFLLVDPDDVQPHNISNQWFPREGSVDRPKVDVVAEEIERYSPYSDVEIVKYPGFFEDFGKHAGVIISGLDSLPARRAVWESVKKAMPKLYIDCRMGGEAGIVYVVDPSIASEVRRYEKTLDQDPYPLPCTAQAIAYNLSGIEMVVGSTIRAFVKEDAWDWRVLIDSRNRLIQPLP
jgi:molybdopterin/thiamine biosynthesis adenylyltransferase